MAAPTATIVPTTGTTGVTTASPVITVTFSAAVRYLDDSAITNANVADILTLKKTKASGVDVPFTASINAGKTEITVVPDPELAANQVYYLAVDGTAVEDEDNIAGTLATSTFTTSPVTAVVGTAVVRNSILGKALAACDLDGTTFRSKASGENTIIVLYNSGASERVVTVKAPVDRGVTYSITDLTYTLTAGHVGIVNVESALYADRTGLINIDVAHAEVQIAVFYKN